MAGVTKTGWWDADWPYRLSIQVNAGGYERYDKPAEVTLDLVETCKGLNVDDVDVGAFLVVEVDGSGNVVDEAVSFQFDPAGDDSGDRDTLVLMLKGITPARATRRFYLYFDAAGVGHAPAAVPTQVAFEGVVEDEGQGSFKIATQNATYYYHRFGAGFSSMVDVDGQDWLGYRPGGGSAGEYRGIPNMGYPEGYCHPGKEVSDSRVIAQGPLRVSILSKSADGVMRCRWDVFPHYARLTVLKMRTPYWFLYEGTPGGNPGGKLDEERGFCVRSTGQRTPIGKRWEGDIPDPEWLYFGAGNTQRVIYLVHHEDDDCVDSYWPMEGNMTVFGFGRLGLDKFMDRVPAHFTVGFAEDGDYEAASRVIDSAFRELDVRLGRLEVNG